MGWQCIEVLNRMKRKSLYLIGAGDFGREMESWLELLPGFSNEWKIEGYLDKNPHALDGYPSDFSIVGDPLEFPYRPDDYVIMCLSGSVSKEMITEKLRDRVNFFTYIAPNSIISKFSKIGMGSIIAPNCIISTNVLLGDFVTLNSGTQIGHDVVIDSYSSLMANVDLGGHVKIGKGVFIGTNATVIPGRSVTDKVTIGAGSIVLRNIKRPGTYFGNPAKFISD